MALTRRVLLQQRSMGKDGLGQRIEAWTTFATVWAEILHPSGAEQIKSGAEVSVVKASIKVNRRAGIDAGMRALHGGKTYDIEAVLPDEVDRQYMFLVCQVIE